VEEVLPSALFRVRMNDGREVIASMAPRLRHAVVRLIGGSRVKVELSSRDPSRGQIVEKL
jgi:translation initiation factor IF-1